MSPATDAKLVGAASRRLLALVEGQAEALECGDFTQFEALFGELVQVGFAQRRRGLAHVAKIHRPARSQSARNRASSKPDPERRNVAPADS